MQPFNICVYGPLQIYFEQTMDPFQETHVSRIINQIDVRGLFRTTNLRVATTHQWLRKKRFIVL